MQPPTKKKGDFKSPLLGLLATLFVAQTSTCIAEPIIIGSKKFTESYVLAEIAKRAIENSAVATEHRQGMGGTIILWQALRGNQIALYPEYTGTISEEILKTPPSISAEEMREQNVVRRAILLEIEHLDLLATRRDEFLDAVE